MTEKLKQVTPYLVSVVTVILAIIWGWNAMNMRMAETDSRIKVLEIQQSQYAITERKQDEKLELFQNTYISTVQSIAIINTKLDMILDKKK